MRILSYMILIPLFWGSCQKDNETREPFSNEIRTLEEDPKAALSHLSIYQIDTIKDRQDATIYLLKSLAEYYTLEKNTINKQMLLQAACFFQSGETTEQLLETLYLLVRIYQEEKNMQSELETLEKAIKIAKDKEKKEWLLYLYSHFSDMYMRKYDILGHTKYQVLANEQIKDIDKGELNVSTKLLISQNYMYTNKLENAVSILRTIHIDNRHESYRDLKRIFGIYHYLKGEWDLSISALEESVRYENLTNNKFTCYTMLINCYLHLGDIEKANRYKDLASRYDNNPEEISFEKITFYEVCTKLLEEQCLYAKQIEYMKKSLNLYQFIVNDLNKGTLNEAIQIAGRIQDKRLYHKKARQYQLLIIGIISFFSAAIIIYINRKRKQAILFISLQKQIKQLEELSTIKDQTKVLILQNFEIGKKIALLRHTQKEKSGNILKELDKLGITQNNELLNSQWEKFYHHIDISFHHFHKKLRNQFPFLAEKEIQLCCLMLAGFHTDEIAAVWGQSVFSVHKTKTNIRKKLNTEEGADIIVFLQKNLVG